MHSSDKAKCVLEFCDRPGRAKSGGLCSGHDWQKRNDKPFTPLRSYGDPEWTFREAVLSYADATESNRDERAAWERLRSAGRRYFGRASGQTTASH